MDDVPHLTLPLRLVGGAYMTVQQDTVEELTTTVAVICAFELGSRPERPDFGIRAPELADEPLDVTDIEQAVGAYEARAVVTVTEQPASVLDPLAARIQVQVSMAREEEEEIA